MELTAEEETVKTERAKKWISSEEGRAALKEAVDSAERLCECIDNANRFDWRELWRPIGQGGLL